MPPSSNLVVDLRRRMLLSWALRSERQPEEDDILPLLSRCSPGSLYLVSHLSYLILIHLFTDSKAISPCWLCFPTFALVHQQQHHSGIIFPNGAGKSTRSRILLHTCAAPIVGCECWNRGDTSFTGGRGASSTLKWKHERWIPTGELCMKLLGWDWVFLLPLSIHRIALAQQERSFSRAAGWLGLPK